MNTTLSARHESAWSIIEKEKQRDQIIRRISFVAWTITAYPRGKLPLAIVPEMRK
jgi:hypothetical protein